MRLAGHKTAALDILYWATYRNEQLSHGRDVGDGNPLDINSDAGFVYPSSIWKGPSVAAVVCALKIMSSMGVL